MQPKTVAHTLPSLEVALESVTAASPTSRILRLAWPLAFQPGQAIQLRLPGEDKSRYFSISSSPTETGYVEITIKVDRNDRLRAALSSLKPGALLPVSGPYGAFSLPSDVKGPLCFIASGSGITPFRSMIKFLIDEKRLPESWVFHSARSREDFIFHEQFTQWQGAHPTLHYIPTLTQQAEADWVFETGRITEKLLRKHIELEAHYFLLCGSPAFVSDMEMMLQSLGIAVSQIRREQW